MLLAPDGSPIEDENAQIRIYVYDPAKASWAQGAAEHVDPKDTIACKDGQLILVGGAGDTTGSETSSVRLYDLTEGAGKTICALSGLYYRPQVACKDGVLFVYDVYGYCFERITDGKTEVLNDALPEYYRSTQSDLFESNQCLITERDGVLVPVSDGVLLIGPTAADGSGDTFLLRDGENQFEPYAKRMSDEKVNFPAAAALRGYVYAIGSVMYEPGQSFFRRAAAHTCAESIQRASVVLSASSFTFNGKEQKPVVKTIAGQKLQEGTDYTAVWSNAGSKNAGDYSVTITGKGNYCGQTSAVYQIKKAANNISNITPASKTLKYSSVKKKDRTFTIKATDKFGAKMTYAMDSKTSKAAKKYITITKAGKVKVKIGTPKKTYKVKVKVKAAGTKNYTAKTVTKRLKIIVK